MAWLVQPKTGYRGQSEVFASKAEAKSFAKSEDARSKSMGTGGVKYKFSRTLLTRRDVNRNPSIPAQLRRLPSGEIQLKIPLSAKNVKAQVQAIRKALGRRVKSAVIVGGKIARKLSNPGYWVMLRTNGPKSWTHERHFRTKSEADTFAKELRQSGYLKSKVRVKSDRKSPGDDFLMRHSR